MPPMARKVERMDPKMGLEKGWEQKRQAVGESLEHYTSLQALKMCWLATTDMFADEYVIPGNIIFKQRGTNWYPGENVGIGRDHTIFALETGYVKYYRNPMLHPKRRYIGVVFDRSQKLPSSPTAPRRRKLNMIAVPRKEDEPGSALNQDAVGFSDSVQDSHGQIVTSSRTAAPVRSNNDELKMRPDYSYRESNWQIGRAAEKAGVKVREFVPGDRFRAWRKANVRRSKAAERRALVKKKTGKKKAKARAR
ncbi:MAG: hypothetical protein Q9159_000138 [Coniocarpon cinnabarinum]